MWEFYQPAIFKWMFCPYLIYLVIICYNSGYLMGHFMQIVEQMEEREKEEPDYASKSSDRAHRDRIRMQGLGLTVIALLLLLAFFSLELKQMNSMGMTNYLADVWNIIDLSSAMLNLSFSTMFIWCLVTDEVNNKINKSDASFSFVTTHTVAGFACMFMWLKVFYWCRLFSNLAYYVKLI